MMRAKPSVFYLVFISAALLAGFPAIGAEKLSMKDAVARALSQNPLVSEAALNIASQLHKDIAVHRERFGSLSIDYNYNRSKDPPYMTVNTPAFGGDFETGKRDDVIWGISAKVPIFTGFDISTREAIERLGVDVKRVRKKEVELDVAAAAKRAYLTVLLAERNLNTAEDADKRLTAHLRVAKALYGQGMTPYNDVLKAEVALSQTQQQLVARQEELGTARAGLNLVMHEKDIEKTYELRDPPEDNQATMEPGLNGLFKKSLANRPELKAISLAIDQARLKTTLARGKVLPKIYLVGRYEQHGEDLLANKNIFDNQNNLYTGINMEWLLFDWNRHGQEEAAIEKDVMALKKARDAALDNIRLEVRSAWGRLRAARRNIETARLALAQAKEDLRITRLQYGQQVASATDVIDSETTLTKVMNNYYKTLYTYKMALVDLDRACGVLDVDEQR